MESVKKSYENITAGQCIRTIGGQVKQFTGPSILTPVAMILEVLMETLIPFLMASIIDKGVETGDLGHIYRIGALMILFALLSLSAGIAGGVLAARASAGLAMNLRNAMYRNIQTFSFSNIDKYSSSGLVTRLTTDVTNIQNAYQMLLRMCMRSPVSLLCAMGMAFFISPPLASVYLAAVVFLSIFLIFIIRKTTGVFRQVFEKYDDLNASVQENVSAIRVVKAYVREEHEKDKFNRAVQNLYGMFVRAEKLIVLNFPVMQLTIYSCILLVSYLGARLIIQDSLSTGELMSMLAYCMNILMNLMMLSMIFVMMTMSAASMQRVTEVITEKSGLEDPADPIMEVKDGSIVFDHVGFGYNKTAQEQVLKEVSLSIRSGETIGIIGGTGSAKSTLVSLIPRLYDVTEGSVRVGGEDVRKYSLDALRSQVAVVLQQNNIFTGTILENLRWGSGEATEEECRRACRIACADEFIQQMPMKYETQIERGGTNVSGGQKQRLCIARALLKKPKIIIFDDSTSAVDTATEARIRKALDEELPGMTKLIIAQRVSSVEHADRIIVMEDGRVSGFGTHEELLASNEIYRDVYESQTGGLKDFDSLSQGDQ
ncbi:MAG: ABC transporter ATP-binding protein/permease [Lachnospiraceae bacterium]|nr:ABC transporter ATP-binding protein/permease [Lachnospiraceae bacterium]